MIASLIVAQILLPLSLIAWLAIAPLLNLLGISLQVFVTGIILYQFTKVWLHFCELKPRPCKGFESIKWLRHFVLWYNYYRKS